MLSALDIPGNIKLFTVQSGSMEPAIRVGSLIVVKPSDTYSVGDIVNIKEPADPDISVTHRIVEVEEADNQIHYITKGDANESADTEKRSHENIVGKMIFKMPLMGYLISFGRTPEGLLLLVIIPALIIIFREVMSIRDEAKKMLEKRKQKKESESMLSMAKLFFLIPLAGFAGIAGTGAYLHDTEVSAGNTFTAGTWGTQLQQKQSNSIQKNDITEKADNPELLLTPAPEVPAEEPLEEQLWQVQVPESTPLSTTAEDLNYTEVQDINE